MSTIGWDTIYAEIRESLANMTREERFETARQYMLNKYAEAIK